MSDQTQRRVDELLTEADTASRAAIVPDADESAADRSIGETAREASELLDSSDPQTLLAGVGLETLPDGTEPQSIPEAIVNGDPERVDDLKRLVALSKLADRDDRDLNDAAATLGAAIDDARSADGRAERAGSGGDDSDADDSDVDDSGDDDSAVDDSITDLESQLRSTLSDRIEQFDDDVSGLQEQLASVADSAADDTDGTGGGDAEEKAETTEPSSEADDDSDDLLGIGGDGDGFGSSESSRYSTMAPPPSDRADMRAVKRHSTMPDTQ